MRALGNILWHIPFLGFLTALSVLFLGVLLTVSIVAAPIGLGLIQYSKFLFWPFGNAMVSKSDLDLKQNPLWKTYSTIVTIIYFPFGLILAIVGAFQAVAFCLTIVGIPVALVVAKSLGTFLNPVNKISVSKAVAEEIQVRKAKAFVDQKVNA